MIGSETAGTLQVYEINLGRGDIQAQGSPTDPVSIAAVFYEKVDLGREQRFFALNVRPNGYKLVSKPRFD